MAAENRRTSDHEVERIWNAIGDLRDLLSSTVQAVQTHAAVCTSDKQRQREHEDKTAASLERLVRAADEREMVGRLARAAVKWVAGGATAIGTVWAAMEHVWPLVVRMATKGAVALILLSGPSAAHEDDQFLRELQTPTGGSCCSERDCSLTDDWDQRSGAYRVRIEGAWREVPAEIVIRDKPPHPSGRAVLCVLPAGQWICFLPGSQGV